MATAVRALYRTLLRSARRIEGATSSKLTPHDAKTVANGIAATLLTRERVAVPKEAVGRPPTDAVRACFRLGCAADADEDADALDRGFVMLRSASHLLSALESPWGALVLQAEQPGGCTPQASEAAGASDASHASSAFALERGAVVIARLCSLSTSEPSSADGEDAELEREHERAAEQLAQLARQAADVMPRSHAEDEDCELDPQQEQARAAVPAEHAQHTQLRHLVRAFFSPAPHGLGFRGEADDYYNPMQSSLPSVLDRRAGLPITMAVAFAAVAARQTPPLQLQGVNTPAHFILRLDTAEDELEEATGDGARLPVSAKPIFCDAFHGVLLSVADVARRVKFALGGQLTQDDLERALEPLPAPLVWLRMLRNLAVTFADDDADWHDEQKVATCEEAISHIDVLTAIARVPAREQTDE